MYLNDIKYLVLIKYYLLQKSGGCVSLCSQWIIFIFAWWAETFSVICPTLLSINEFLGRRMSVAWDIGDASDIVPIHHIHYRGSVNLDRSWKLVLWIKIGCDLWVISSGAKTNRKLATPIIHMIVRLMK